jgi:hypothetical protein
MSKKEVERNEEGLFRKWLDETDKSVGAWQLLNEEKRRSKIVRSEDPDLPDPEPTSMPPSTTYFERNIEVWRQLYGSRAFSILSR